MNARNRKVRLRAEREESRKRADLAFSLSMQQIKAAIAAAEARGEHECTEQFLREAFGCSPNEATVETPK